MKRFCRRLVQSVLSLLTISLLASHSQATTVRMLSDEELVVNSRFIITGEVRSVISAWDDAGTFVWTYIEISRDRVLKGNLPAETIVLKQPGGVVGRAGVRVFGQPTFLRGQQVLLYLNTGPSGTLRVAHAFMGMFLVEEDPATGEKIVTRPVDETGVQILARRDNQKVTDRAPFADYVRRIEETLHREAALVARIDSEREWQIVQAVPVEYQARKTSGSDYSLNFVLFANGIRWMEPDSGQPVVFRVNPDRSPIEGGAAAELTRAMDAWRVQSGANIRLQTGDQTDRCGSEGDGINVISFGDCKNQLDPPSGCSGVLAQTTVFWTSQTKIVNGRTFRRIVESDVVFNKNMECFLASSANLAEVACHELGHAIGLDHPSDNAAIMRAFAHGNGRDATLASDDIDGVLTIYPDQAGGQLPAPVVTKVNVKSAKKIVVVGQNFSQNSLVILNGATIVPKSVNSAGKKIKCKGDLNLKPSGSNSLIVVEGTKSSAVFFF
ncbi:MAG: matrixin family metalloprotease [Blastocatellia bacterium]|nr:matrixin family metalloprotease [Blastocatellia bacterium]